MARQLVRGRNKGKQLLIGVLLLATRGTAWRRVAQRQLS